MRLVLPRQVVLCGLIAVSTGIANKIITTPLPETVEVCVGQDTTICVYAIPLVAGDQLRYRWYKDGTQIPGEDQSCLTIRNPQFVDDQSLYEVEVESYYVTGNNQVVVTARERSATTLRVYEPATIISQAQNWSGCEGRLLTLSVTVSGSGLSFQWYREGQPVPGANSSTYSAIASPQQHNGTWWCVITNPCGSITTDRVRVEVRELPQITRQPSSIAECVGRQVTLNVEATGASPLNYQWYRNGVPVGTGQSYTFTVDRTTEGEYWVVVSNQCGQTQSRRVVVTAYLPPQITLQPQSVRASQGQRIVLRVEAAGKLPLRYQWQKNGQDIPGATSNTYVIDRAQKADEGRYRCRVQNDCGEASSNEAEVVVEAVSVSSGTEASGYRLYPVTPSPVVGTALVRFIAPGMNPMRLALYDAYGRRVTIVAEGNFESEHALWLRPEEFGLAPGVYMLRLETRDMVLQQPFIVVR